MEQHLEFLLHHANTPEFVTGSEARFPDTSFRLKCVWFKKIYARHPNFAAVHHIADPVCIGLKKANQSRVRMVHSNIQGFDKGPPPTVRVTIVKFKGADLHPFHGTWTLEAIENFNQLLCFLSGDLQKISVVTMTPEFRQSLGKELSRTQRASIMTRHLLSRYGVPGAAKNTGGDACSIETWLFENLPGHSGARAKRANPESRNAGTACRSGFRVRRKRAVPE